MLGGGGSLLAFQFVTIRLKLCPVSFDDIPGGGEFLVFELLFEFVLASGGGGVLLLELGKFFRNLGGLPVAA